MNIVYAAEKSSIADLLGDYEKCAIQPDDIEVLRNPNETGSFYVGWRFKRYLLSPSGQIVPKRLAGPTKLSRK